MYQTSSCPDQQGAPQAEMNRPAAGGATPESRKLTVVPADRVHGILGFQEVLTLLESSLKKPMNEWKMELDDAPIFRYLYRNFQPRRHLEFGTWQGYGAVLCLEESSASVWTVNLPFGEKNESGTANYGSDLDDHAEELEWADKVGLREESVWSTDSLGFIGRHYLARGLGHRVFQVYSDSTKWDSSNLPDGFFDSVLIDGGHTKEAVVSDTRKAFELVRPGGLVMWHDFCPPIFKEFEGTRGVMAAIGDLWPTIQSMTSRVFWIEPSWILVGVRNATGFGIQERTCHESYDQ